ncbi:hypothetical protein [Rhodospirillaceae bacterium SYSU D60014]|uniref:hypothetical protein n=1 Tax=Virgifigura deserti TaxID=2268457 RepID=UPI0013C5292E
MQHPAWDAASLHRAIVRAHAAGEVEIAVSFRAVNRTGAPGFRTTDIVVPPFVILVLSLYVLFAVGPVAGTLALLAGMGLLLFVLRPRNKQRTMDRTRALALAKLEDWQALWRLGGLALRSTRDPARDCISPDGDWQAFARDHLMPAPAPTPAPGETVSDTE